MSSSKFTLSPTPSTLSQPKSLSVLDEEYVTVNGKAYAPVVVPDQKDQKSVQVPALLRLRGTELKKTQKPITVDVIGSYGYASAAATALTTVQALSPIAVQDFSSFAALYDLCRVKSLKLEVAVQASGSVNGYVDVAWSFDPSNLGAYSSVADIMTSRHHVGPIHYSGETATGVKLLGSVLTSKTGFHPLTVHLKAEKRITNDGTAAALVGGGWFGTSDTTSVIGWFKPYFPSFGPGIVSSFTMYVTYTCEFASRT